MYLKQGDFERAMSSFKEAQSHTHSRQGFHLVTILLASLVADSNVLFSYASLTCLVFVKDLWHLV